jgi:AraC-like DNA-binding protein
MAMRERKYRDAGRRAASGPAGDELAALGDVLAGKAVAWLSAHPEARLSTCRLGDARALEARVSPVRIAQPAAGQGAPAAGYHLTVHLAGEGRYRHDAGSATLREGSVALLDASAACEVVHADGAHVVTWALPHREVAPFLPSDSGPLVELARAPAEVVAAQAVALARAARRIPEAAAAGLAGQLASAVGLALACGASDAARTQPDHRALMRRRVLALIEARFREPGLTPTLAARDLGMSRRWLVALLAGTGAGFAERLAARRIEECVRLLRDPGARNLTVTQIALAAGFHELSTFHRQFRGRVGTTPGRLR